MSNLTVYTKLAHRDLWVQDIVSVSLGLKVHIWPISDMLLDNMVLLNKNASLLG
jgi:hypothetical protein